MRPTRRGTRRVARDRRGGAATAEDAGPLADLERDANLVGLAHVFGDLPFPYDAVLTRWVLVLDDPDVVTEVVAGDQGLVAFAAYDPESLRHLAVHPDAWGRGIARDGVARAVAAGVTRLWVLDRQPPCARALRVARLGADRRHAGVPVGAAPDRAGVQPPRIPRVTDALLEIADELYGLPLADFTPARDALAKEHKARQGVRRAGQGAEEAVARGLGRQPARTPRRTAGRAGARRRARRCARPRPTSTATSCAR